MNGELSEIKGRVNEIYNLLKPKEEDGEVHYEREYEFECPSCGKPVPIKVVFTSNDVDT